MSILRESVLDELAEGQQVYRLVREASGRPGKVLQLPPTQLPSPQGWPVSALQVARTLLTPQFTFSVHGQKGERLAQYLSANSGARYKPAYSVDYLLVGPPVEGFDVWSPPSGVLSARGRGTSLVLACALLAEPGFDMATPVMVENGALLALEGPAIPWRRALAVDGASAQLLSDLAALREVYQSGVDVILAGPEGRIAVLRLDTRWHLMGPVDGIGS